MKIDVSNGRYLDLFADAFMLYKAERYDVKGRKYIGSSFKYYIQSALPVSDEDKREQNARSLNRV